MRSIEDGPEGEPAAASRAEEASRRLAEALARRRMALGGAQAPLPADIAPLLRRGYSLRLACAAARLAEQRGGTARDELFALPGFDRAAYWRGLAEHLELGFVGQSDGMAIDPALGYVPTAALRRASATMAVAGGRSLLLVAPEPDAIEGLRRFCRTHPTAAARMRIAPPEVIRTLLLTRFQRPYVYCAVNRLARSMPRLSAASATGVATVRQTLLVLAALATILAAASGHAWIGVGLILSVMFLNSVAWKLAAALTATRSARHRPLADRDLPTYTILVPLYREANMVPDIVAAMAAIEYPRSKLQVLLIAEADDDETLDALRRHAAGPPFEIVAVPAMQPRTKPKALTFAVPFARGDMVVVYDAEDRPEPGQLRQAAAAFAAEPALGCVQARLTPDNSETWLARMFTIEYAANFEVLLPALARWRVPLPLGGTSNHFPGLM